MRVELSSQPVGLAISWRADGYDLFIGGGSWDARCRLAVDAHAFDYVRRVVLVRYADMGATGAAEQNLSAIRDGAIHASTTVDEVLVDARDTRQAWRVLRASIVQAYRSAGRPLDLLVDLSSLPRYLSLGLLGFGYRAGILRRASFLHGVAGEYDYRSDPQGDQLDDLGFTRGSWRPIPVVGLSGGGTGASRSHLIATLGFDGAKTRKTIHLLEPSSLTLIYAETVETELHVLAKRENAELRKSFPANSVHELTLGICDVEGVRDACISAIEKYSVRDLEVNCLVAGSKLHSLGVALAALERHVDNFYYALPEFHREVDATPVKSTVLVDVITGW